jgi:hypothetical protein
VGLSGEVPGQVRFIAVIKDIWNVSEPQVIQCVDINWYFTKADLPPYLRHDFISNKEVFLSDLTTSFYANNIVRKIRILNEAEANDKDTMNDDERVSRAAFSKRTNTFDPPPEKWTKSCVCQQPINYDLEYVLC